MNCLRCDNPVKDWRRQRFCSSYCRWADARIWLLRQPLAELRDLSLPFPNYRRELQTAMLQKRDWDHRTEQAPRCA